MRPIIFPLLLALSTAWAQTSFHQPDPTADDKADAYPEITTQNALGTRLIRYTGCNKADPTWRGKINEAYSDFQKIADTAGVKSDISWDEAAALEYLGPSAFNKNQQKQIQAVLTNVATVYPGWLGYPFTHWIHVRCDDPQLRCPKKPQDPCEPPDPNRPKGGAIAYATNKDAESGYPMINFCPVFFSKPSLSEAMAEGSGKTDNSKFNLETYENRAAIMYHEMTHLDLAADSSGDNTPNPRIVDLKIDYEETDGTRWRTKAYGPLRTKMLARYEPPSPNDPMSTGWYVQRNADNLALFALAKYVQSKIGSYPHLPVVYQRTDGPPDDFPWLVQNTVLDYYPNANPLKFDKGELTSFDNIVPSMECRLDDQLLQTTIAPLNLNKLASDAEYPQAYQTQRAAWIKDLQKTSTSTTPTTPIGSPTCWNNNVPKVSPVLRIDAGHASPDDILFRMREVICNDKCENPAGIESKFVSLKPGPTSCEMYIAMSATVEAYFVRTSPSQGSQWQQCWDSTENIINKCVNNGPNKGWWNGPDYGQFYEVGFRALDPAHFPNAGNSDGHLIPPCEMECSGGPLKSRIVGSQPIRCTCACEGSNAPFNANTCKT